MAKSQFITSPAFLAKQHGMKFWVTRMPAKHLAVCSYAAVRGKDDEEGAVQRVLNRSRIASIKEFVLGGGTFPNSVILNWVKPATIRTKDTAIEYLPEKVSAQIIDGQHRIAGLKAAIASNSKIGSLEMPVVVFTNLSTKECADIFLSINTEQKSVPKSLVFDLYAVASEGIVDIAAQRARDIATYLNDEEESPYCGEIKFPGSPRKRGGVALSSVVSALKPLVEDKGSFEQIGANELELQQQIVLNLFKALANKYKDQWEDKSNPFIYAGGFVAAVRFLQLKLLPHCNITGSFTQESFEDVLDLKKDDLISQDEVRNKAGQEVQTLIFERLDGAFKPGRQGNKKIRV